MANVGSIEADGATEFFFFDPRERNWSEAVGARWKLYFRKVITNTLGLVC